MRLVLISLLMIPFVVGCGGGGDEKPAADTDADADADADMDISWTEVSAGTNHSCGVTISGSVECWGLHGFVESSPPSGSYQSVSAGWSHSCGVTTNGSVECWGVDEEWGDDGQTSPPSGSFQSVSAGWYHTCGVTTNGSVKCWGEDEEGQSSPPGGAFQNVSGGAYHSCGITTDGDVACWGRNRNGSTEPPDLSLTVYDSFSSIHAGGSLTCGVTTGSSRRVLCWGEPYWDAAAPTGMYGTDGATHYTDVKTSGGHTCGLAFTPGDRPWVHCAGYNGSGECDTEDTGWVTSLEVFGPRTCAISRSESGRLLQCWGESDFVVDDVPPDHEFNTVTLGGWHACALTTDDKAVCWGDNERGQTMQPQAAGHVDARSP